MDQWCVWVCREHGPACTEYQRACNDPCVTASIRTRELETSTNDVLAKDQFLSSQVLKWHCIIDVIRSETKANDLTDFLGEQWELPKKPGDDYFCFVSRIKISDSPCHLKTIIKLWKRRVAKSRERASGARSHKSCCGATFTSMIKYFWLKKSKLLHKHPSYHQIFAQ